MTTHEHEEALTPGLHKELRVAPIEPTTGVQAPREGAVDVRSLFKAHATFVAAFARRLGVADADVDDLVQEVFLVAHRKGGFVPGAGQPRTWLASIAVRVASTSRRTRARRREDPGGSQWLDAREDAHDPARALEAKRSLERVHKALEGLDLERRATFVLYEIEGESCEAIAAAFGVPVGTIYSRLHYARKAFTDAYAELAGAPHGTSKGNA